MLYVSLEVMVVAVLDKKYLKAEQQVALGFQGT